MEMGRIVVIDCQAAGISGDMLLGALIDLGADVAKLSTEVMRVVKDSLGGCQELRMEVAQTARRGIRAVRVDIQAEEEVCERRGAEIKQGVVRAGESLRLSEEAKRFALNAVTTLIEAEARIHGESGEEVHLHELGSADTLADMVGVAAALDELGFFRDTVVCTTPVSVGGGLVDFSHGTVSVPAPVTLEVLRARGFPVLGQDIGAELATPTGVSLLASLAHRAVRCYPLMKPVAVGYGAGARDLPGVPNILRIVVGEDIQERLSRDMVYVLETNVDDVSGEVIGHTIDRVLREGARDFSIIPMFTKKNRPGHILKVIADEETRERLAALLMEETGTLGVRVYPCERYVLERESVMVDIMVEGQVEKVSVRVARDRRGKILQIKPEYEEVRKLAEKLGRPLRDIMALVQRKALDILAG